MHNDWEARMLRFRVLYRVFLMRVIDLEILSSDADPTRLVGQFATIFSSISFFFTIPVLMGANSRMPMTSKWTAEHFFLETSMTVAGLIVILCWDSTFPDRRDVLILTPFPVKASTLFLAKLSALFAAPGLAILAFNIFSGIAWPVTFLSGNGGFFGALRAWPAYWATLVLCGCFLVFSMLTLQGLAANLLPRQIFLRLSALLQAISLCALLSVYFLEPSLESPAALTAPQNQHLLAWLPSYWFLGLFNQLNGSMHPALVPLARRAWVGLASSAAGATASLLLAYFRMLPKIVEQPEIIPMKSMATVRISLGSPLKNAVTFFALRTLLRSRQHRMIVSFYIGLGLTIVLGFTQSSFARSSHPKNEISIAFLLISILMMILWVMAIRVIASIPISLRANWVFRLTQVRPAHAYQNAIRLAWLTLAVVPVLVILSGAFLFTWPRVQILEHLLTMMLFGMLLVELCLYAFQKIPFTCSYLPGKANLHFVFWACLMIFLKLIWDGANVEGRMLSHPLHSILMLLCGVLVLAATRWVVRRRLGDSEELLFEQEDDVQLVSLNLS